METAPAPPRFIGFCVLMIGVGIAGMGLVHPEKLNADSWVGFAVGAAFAFAGLALLVQPAPGAPPGKAGALNAFFGACLWTTFAALMIWWAFYARLGGTRVSIGPISFLASGRWAWAARAPIALGAVLCGVAAAVAWKFFLDAAGRCWPGSRAPSAAALVLTLGWGGFKLFRPAPPPRFAALAVDAPLTAGFAAVGAAGPAVHGNVTSSGEGAWFGGEADWLDYALPAKLRLDGTAALQVEVRAEPRRGAARSPVETFAAAGPYVLDSQPGRERWRVLASAGDCRLTSDPLPYGRWTTVALAYDEWAGHAALYIDGKRIDRVSCARLPAERLDTLRLGTWHESYQAFTGAVRSVRIFTRVGDI